MEILLGAVGINIEVTEFQVIVPVGRSCFFPRRMGVTGEKGGSDGWDQKDAKDVRECARELSL